MDEFLRKVRYYLRRRRFDAELAEEMEFHRAQAGAKQFGNLTRLQEDSRDAWGWTWLEGTARDLRHGARQLVRNPGFAAVAILSLALGIGASTAVFELLNALQLRSLPVARPGELVEIGIEGGNRGFGLNGGWNSLTYPLWEQIRDHEDAFAGIFAWAPRFETEVGEGTARHQVRASWVSGDAFSILGIPAARGRLLDATDDVPGCAGNVVLGYGYWQRAFAGDASAIGSQIVVRDTPLTVVGVTPPTFFGIEVGRNFDLALPFCLAGQWNEDRLSRRDGFWLGAIGRLRPGWTAERAARYLEAASPAWFEAVSPTGYDAASMEIWDGFRLTATPVPGGISSLRSSYETSLWLLLGITGLVLLVACANLANLTLARSVARDRELGVRMALGASRGRVIRQLCCESLLLAVLGTVAGLGLASILSRGLVAFIATRDNVVELDLHLDWRVLAFSSAVGLAACLCFGLSSAVHSTRGRLVAAVTSMGRGLTSDRRHFSFQRVLIAAQVAISLMLVASSLLFVRSFRNLLTFDAGFQQQGVVFHYLDFRDLEATREQIELARQQALDRLRTLPGIDAASTTTHRPLSGQGWGLTVLAPGAERQEFSRFTWVSPGYFETMDIPLLAGRDFTAFDRAAAPRVLLVNETFVRRFLPDGDPVGRTVRSLAEPGYPETAYEVVGVVGDVKYDELREEPAPIAYAPDAQHPAIQTTAIVTRSSLPLASVRESVRQAVEAVNPGIVLGDSIDLRSQVMDRLVRDRMLAWLAGFFGLVGMGVAAIGLYGVISYIVRHRQTEIGIRIALGASRGGIVWMILRQHARLIAIGLAGGTVGALSLSRMAGGLLFGLTPHDPASFAISVALLAATAACASLVPARRAAGIAPTAALRQD